MFIDRNNRSRTGLIKQHTLEVNSNPYKNKLVLRNSSSNDHEIVRRYGSKQKWQYGKIVERISRNMFKA